MPNEFLRSMDLYQENILDHYRRPRHHGPLADADVTQEEHNPVCGDRLTFYIKFSGDSLAEVSFTGQGCAISQAAASMLCEEAVGRNRQDILSLGTQDVLDLLGVTLGPTRLKCALLSLQGLHNACAVRAV